MSASSSDKPGHKYLKYEHAYEAILKSDYQSLVRICERKDMATQPLSKALRAYAFFKGGHKEEALGLVHEILVS